MKQLIDTNTKFAGFSVVRKLNTHHDGEREVYLVEISDPAEISEPSENKTAILTVFNLNAKRYQHPEAANMHIPEYVNEVRFLQRMKAPDLFPEVIASGLKSSRSHRLLWMIQPHIDANTLTNEIRFQNGINKQDTVKIMDSLFNAVDKITRYTKGGGHYNISTDNILVNYDGDRLRSVHLIGLSNMGPSCNGTTHFQITDCDNRFRAPETANGVFNHISDIYSLGMVLTMMLTGYTYFLDESENIIPPDGMSPLEFRSEFMRMSHSFLPLQINLITEKATNVNPSARFRNVDRFRTFVNKLAKGEISTETHVEPIPKKTKNPDLTVSPPKKKKMPPAKKVSISKGLDDVAGMAELKAHFRRDFIRIVRNPKIAQAYGIKPSNCTLLYGPQGCGKTFIAEKAAQESGLNYRVISPSELGSIYLHGAQQKIAEVFEEAEKKGPMILIFDEFDAIVPKRDTDWNGNQANEVNEMLTRLNNCAARGVYVLATTNRPSLIDPAILRKGRVDKMVFVSLPDKEARRELFRLEIDRRPSADIDFEVLASVTDNYTCADITFIVEECARQCFEETLDSELDAPLPLTMDRLMGLIKSMVPSVSESQRKEYLDLKARMENANGGIERKKVGFLPPR